MILHSQQQGCEPIYDSLTDDGDWSSLLETDLYSSSLDSHLSSPENEEDSESDERSSDEEVYTPTPKSIPDNVCMVTDMLTEQLEQLNPDYCLQRLGCFSQVILAEDSRDALSAHYKIDAHSMSLERAKQQRPGHENELPMMIFVHNNHQREMRGKKWSEDILVECEVCGDDSTGFHYGVQTCEGCKLFFKRASQKSTSFSCNRNQKCTIDRERRNRCKFCRFQKCVKIGMKPKSVRGKDRNGKKMLRKG